MDNSYRFKVIGIFAMVFAILCLGYYIFKGRPQIVERNEQIAQVSSQPISTEKNSGITYKIHITGEVKNPGVYSVDSKARVNDVIEIAGGNTQNANLDRINLAEFIKDGEKIIVPSINEKPNMDQYGNLITQPNFDNINVVDPVTQNYSGQSSVQSTESNLININTASAEKLKELPGVGDSIAQGIINYREQNGPFKAKDDLKNVTRIGSKTYDKLKDLITVQ